jgi:hypothetical protein
MFSKHIPFHDINIFIKIHKNNSNYLDHLAALTPTPAGPTAQRFDYAKVETLQNVIDHPVHDAIMNPGHQVQ